MSVVVDMDGKHKIIAKGAPEEILKRCTRYELDGEIEELDQIVLTDLKEEYDSLSADGFRVLAVAYKDMEVNKEVYSKDDETSLVLKGYIAFLDPPKPTAMPLCRLFETSELLPAAWRDAFAGGPVRLFNPGLLRRARLAIRLPGGGSGPRPANRPLPPRGRPEPGPGSSRPWSDEVLFSPGADLPAQARRWFADPRLYRLAGRLHVYWNSGWHEPHTANSCRRSGPTTCGRLGRRGSCAWPANVALGEKLDAVWRRSLPCPVCDPPAADPGVLPGRGGPHRVPGGRGGGGPSGPAQLPGRPAGGAPPQAVGDHYFAIGHAISASADGYRYAAAVHRFGRRPPFAPERPPLSPLRLPNPQGDGRAFDRLNPAVGEVIYPCGADYADGNWTISYGINDERCAIAVVPHAQVEATLPAA